MPYAIGCLALADAEVDLRGCCRSWMPGVMNVTICVATGRGVGRINGVARADKLVRNTSAGGALTITCRGNNNVPSIGVSVDVTGVGRVGMGGIVERNMTGTGGCLTIT